VAATGYRHTKKRDSLTYFGCLNLKTKKSYWKKLRKSDSAQFNWFPTQLRQKNPNKEIIIILDNATIHKSKKVRGYLEDSQISIYSICRHIHENTIPWNYSGNGLSQKHTVLHHLEGYRNLLGDSGNMFGIIIMIW